MTIIPTLREGSDVAGRTSGLTVFLRILLLLCLFLAGAYYETIGTKSLLNPDVWIHLRTGEWILQNHALPHTALFTRYSELPWVVASWGFDLLLGTLARLFGLRAIPLLLMAFKTVLAILTFLLVRGWSGNFWRAVGLTALVQYILLCFPPLSAMFSALFLCIELLILLESREMGSDRHLWWLPLMFLCWANLDVQFVNGLLVLGVYVAATLVEKTLRRREWNLANSEVPLKSIFIASALSVAATLVTPYFYAPYVTILHNPVGNVGRQVLDSLHSMNFREPQHYVLLLLTMATFFALGRQRPWDLFKISLITVCAAFAFHWQQNMGFIALPAIAVIAGGFEDLSGSSRETLRAGIQRWEVAVTGVLTIALFPLAVGRIPSETILLNRISKDFPVQAADYVRDHHLEGPLYNAQAWGDFLTWYLPEYPVSIDGRIEMYGRDRNEQFFEVSTGIRSPEDDPLLRNSRTFLLKRDSRLYDTLSHLAGLQTVYEDNLAVVLERQSAAPAQAH